MKSSVNLGSRRNSVVATPGKLKSIAPQFRPFNFDEYLTVPLVTLLALPTFVMQRSMLTMKPEAPVPAVMACVYTSGSSPATPNRLPVPRGKQGYL